MNFKKILWVSLLVLVISTYQTDSGIIFGLLLKMLMLKGALFMSMPIAIGAFMMGQGMGFFAGNMMGGYMMLRAANRYHTKEKNKWQSYTHFHHHPKYTGWGSPHYQKGYHSAKAVFKAIDHLNHAKLHALNKAKAAIHGVKSKVKGIKSAVHGSVQGDYGFELNTGNKGYSYQPGKGYTKLSGGYGFPAVSSYGEDYHGHSHGHDSGWSPAPAGYSHGSGGYSPGSGGYTSGWGSSGSQNHEYAFMASKEFKGKPYYEGFKEIPEYHQSPGSLEYHNQDSLGALGTDGGIDLSAGAFDTNSEYSSHSPATSTKWNSPSNTFYTSAYAGPGQEYTGLLTQGGNPSIEKSAEGVDDEEGNESRQVFNTAEAPNEVIEQFLESRLQEESKKVKDIEQKKEAQQLIQLLRKAYLKQLVDSLKKEEEELEKITSRPSPSTSTASSKESRSLSGMDSLEYVKYLIGLSNKEPVTAESRKVQVSTPKTSVFSSTKSVPVSSTFATTTKPTTTTSSTEKSTTTTERLVIVNSTTVKPKPKKTTTESPLFKDTTVEISNVNPEIAAMWVKSESTYVDEKSPFVLRLKREASKEENQVKAFVDDIKRFFTLLSVLDQDQCLQKLVCDVHTKPSSEIEKLGDYEKNIITTFKLMKAMLPENEEDSTTKYRKAALIGETGLSMDICKAAYSACTFSSSQIITLGTQAEKTPGDWTETSSEASTEKSAASRRSDYVTAMPRVRRRVLMA